MRTTFKTCAFSLLFLSMSHLGFSAKLEEPSANPTEIRIVPVEKTPESDSIRMYLVFPEDNAVKVNTPIRAQIRIEGYALATDSSDFPRSKEIFNSSEGQAIRIVIDDDHYFDENEALIDANNDTETYYDQTIDFSIPYSLRPGMHVLRAFPVRSYNESLKGDRCFVSTLFYYKKKKDNFSFDQNGPFLTYNEPRGTFKQALNKPVLLDFYITNCQLSSDGYKVLLTIDGTNKRTLTSWVPYYIYGLKKGTHSIRLQLLDQANKQVSGAFNDVTHQINIVPK